MQFGPNEDFNHYPRTLERDIVQFEAISCDLIYLPAASELYPDGLEKLTQVQVTDLTGIFEGAHRPGHVGGVATNVSKLLNIVRRDVPIFGKRDFQQYRVISNMVEDPTLEVDMIGADTTQGA